MAKDYDYDDEEFDEVEELDEVDEFDDDEDDDIDELEEVDEIDEDEQELDKGRRQLRRGRLTEFGDRIKGGASRPGEESVKKSPFVMTLLGVIIGLVLISLVIGFIILNTSESRAYNAAQKAFDAQSFTESEVLYDKYLLGYPSGEYEIAARMGFHKSKIMKNLVQTSMGVQTIQDSMVEIKEFISVCRDYEEFSDERTNLFRYVYRMADVGAQVAKDQANEECLAISEEAEKLMGTYAPEGKVPVAEAERVRRHQEEASTSIAKQTTLVQQLKEIRGHLKVGGNFDAFQQRQQLIERYPLLADDPDVKAVFAEILVAEKEACKAEKLGREAQTSEPESSRRQATSLTLRTQKSSDLVAGSSQVFAVGKDSCFALDADTGQPRWKRPIGTSPPFMPIDFDGGGLLAYQTLTNELVLLNEADGSLIWRQSIPSVPTGRPLVYQQQIYLTTASGELWNISLSTGKAISRVVFSQPIVGPPAISREKTSDGGTRDSNYMLVAGDEGVVYTLTINPLECVAVSYTGHKIGSVEAPIITTGELHVMCENAAADESRLRVMRMDAKSQQVKVVQSISVEGNVRDECFLRGPDLFIPSSPQRVTAFSVTDEPDSTPLTLKAANQLPNARDERVFLEAGPGGQLWMASTSLRTLQLKTDALELRTGAEANGRHLRPITFHEQGLFVTTQEPYSQSVFFTKVNPTKNIENPLQGVWRTVIGTNVVAVAPTTSGESVLIVGDFGSVFRVPLDEIGKAEFRTDDYTSYQIPAKLESAIGGLTLKDGRVAAYCGGSEPQLWTFTPAGQLEQAWKLAGAPDVPPVSLANGAVVAIAGRLDMVGSRERVSGYLAVKQGADRPPWKSLTALNDTQVLAIDGNNEAVRIEYRSSPSPHLFEVSRTRLPEDVEVRPSASGDVIAMNTVQGNLLAMSTATLELMKSAPLGKASSRPPYMAANRIFVDVGQKELRCYSKDGQLQQTGVFDLAGRFVVSDPVAFQGGFVACLSDGTVVVLDKDGNATDRQVSLGQSAAIGPVRVKNRLVVVGTDGSLYTVEDILR